MAVLISIIGLSTLTLATLLLFYLPAVARPNTRPPGMPPSRCSVTIIIPFFNEPFRSLIEALEGIERQQYQGQIAVILVDDGSANATSAHVAQWMSQPRRWCYHLQVLRRNGGRKGKALDVAMRLMSPSAEVVTVIDSDTVLAPEALQRAVDLLMQYPSNVACCGYIIPVQRQGNLIEKLQYHEHTGFLVAVKQAQSKIGKVAVIAGAFSLHRTAAVSELGGWGDWLVEDVAWTWKALARGYSIVYAHDAIAHTLCPHTFGQLFRQRRRWARGKIEAVAAAWQTSRGRSLLLMPWTLLWVQVCFCPSLLILLLAMVLQVSWALVLASGLNLCLVLALYLLAHKGELDKCKTTQARRVGVAIKATAYNQALDILNIPANVLGILDGLLNRKKHWLTRQPVRAHAQPNKASLPDDADAPT